MREMALQRKSKLRYMNVLLSCCVNKSEECDRIAIEQIDLCYARYFLQGNNLFPSKSDIFPKLVDMNQTTTKLPCSSSQLL